MRFSKFVQKVVAVGTSAALVMSLGGGVAFAKDGGGSYTAPTEVTPITNSAGARYATAIGAHGSAVVGEYVGLSEQVNQIYATPGNGVSTSNYMYNPYYGIYGSNANSNPDPYVANLFYNWSLKAQSLTDDEYKAKAAENYMYNYVFDGYSGSAFTSDNKTFVNGTSRALSGRPDVLTLKGDGVQNFVKDVAKINAFASTSEYYKKADSTYVGDDKYDPEVAGYKETHMKELIESVYDEAEAALGVVEKSKKDGVNVTLRYDDPWGTAQKYEKLIKGSNLYVLSKIADKTVPRRTVAFVTSIADDNTITLASSVDITTSGEQTHNIEPTLATCDNLADKLYEQKNGTALVAEAKSKTVECTAEELADADVILMANPDNIAYHLDATTGEDSGIKTYSPNAGSKGYDNLSTEPGKDGSDYWRGTTVDDKSYYKNQYYGPMAWTNGQVAKIKAALNSVEGEKAEAAKALAEKEIMSCVGENASAQDGGSVDAMDLQPIINAFVYPEIMNQFEHFGYFLENIAHISTDKVGGMVQVLAQDMSAPTSISLADITNYSSATSAAVEKQYDDGLAYYEANKSEISSKYPWLVPTANLTATAPEYTGENALSSRAPAPAPAPEPEPEPAPAPTETKIAVPSAKTGLTYTGKEQTGVDAGTGYTLSGTTKATKAGSYKATATLQSGYKWADGTTAAKSIDWSIAKGTQKITAAKTYKVKAKDVKKASKKISVKFTSTSGKKVTYAKATGASKKIVLAKNGKLTVKKGCKKGTYKLSVKASAAGNDNYKKISTKVALKVKVA